MLRWIHVCAQGGWGQIQVSYLRSHTICILRLSLSVFGAFSRVIWPTIVPLVSSCHPSQGSNTSSHAQLVCLFACLCNMCREIYKVSTQSLVDIRCLPLLPSTILPWDGVLVEPEAHWYRHAGWAPFPNTGVIPAQRLRVTRNSSSILHAYTAKYSYLSL